MLAPFANTGSGLVLRGGDGMALTMAPGTRQSIGFFSADDQGPRLEPPDVRVPDRHQY
jgi:hypothetical protein